MNEAFRFGKRDHRLLMRLLCLRKILSAIFISNHFYPLWLMVFIDIAFGMYETIWEPSSLVVVVVVLLLVHCVVKAHKVKPENDVRSMSLIWIFCNAISKCMAFNKGAPWMPCSKKGTHTNTQVFNTSFSSVVQWARRLDWLDVRPNTKRSNYSIYYPLRQ